MNAFLRLAEPSPETKNRGLAVLRVVIGFTFLMHGWQKLFELGISGTIQLYVTLGAPLPQLTGPLFGAIELFGGAALLLGLGTRWVTPLLAIDMLAAILIVKLPHGFFAPTGYEHEFVLLGSVVTLALTGSGAFALDRLVAHARERAALVH